MKTMAATEELGRQLAAHAILRGVRTDRELAEMLAEEGFEVSQQSCNNYKRGRKVPPTAFIVAFVRALNLDARSTRTLLRTYMRVRPEMEEFVRLWFDES